MTLDKNSNFNKVRKNIFLAFTKHQFFDLPSKKSLVRISSNCQAQAVFCNCLKNITYLIKNVVITDQTITISLILTSFYLLIVKAFVNFSKDCAEELMVLSWLSDDIKMNNYLKTQAYSCVLAFVAPWWYLLSLVIWPKCLGTFKKTDLAAVTNGRGRVTSETPSRDRVLCLGIKLRYIKLIKLS